MNSSFVDIGLLVVSSCVFLYLLYTLIRAEDF